MAELEHLLNTDDCWCNPIIERHKEGKIIVHHTELCFEANKDLSEKICLCDISMEEKTWIR